MSVTLPGSTVANLVAEYVVTNASFNQQLYTGSDGFLNTSLTLNLNYEKNIFN